MFYDVSEHSDTSWISVGLVGGGGPWAEVYKRIDWTDQAGYTAEKCACLCATVEGKELDIINMQANYHNNTL